MNSLLKFLGWLFVPYIMLPLRWKHLSNAKQIGAFAWIALIVISAISNIGSEEPVSPETTVAVESSDTHIDVETVEK
jgi:hypothetical protein